MKPFQSRKVVCFGEVLWDILPTASLPGGAPMNVAYHLKRLGNDPSLITKTGDDENGQKLKELLNEAGVNTDFFQLCSTHPTGIVIAKPNEQNEVTYDIVHPVAWDFINWDDRFPAALNEAEFFICGSLAARDEVSRDTLYRLIDAAKIKIVDINLRPPHFNREGIEYLLKKADIAKLNLSELELITSWYGSFADVRSAMKQLQQQFHIPTIIVTLGGDGAVVLHEEAFYQHAGYRVKVADTIGSGDAFLAGFIHQLLSGASIETALNFACGLGALVATHSGACPVYNASDINELSLR